MPGDSVSCMSGMSQITYKSSWLLSIISGIKLVVIKPLCIYCLLESAACVLSRNCSLPGSSICGILQAKILEWVAISFSFNVSGVHLLSLVHFAEKAMAPHSSTLAWKFPWMEEPSRLRSMGSLRVGHD